MHRRFLCLLVAGTLIAPPVIAQQTDQPPLTFRVEANFVEVDAFVSDAAGKPITDLRAGDFQLLDVTDPRHPVRTDDWGAGKDGGLPFGIAGSGLPAPFDCTPPPGQRPLCRGHSAAIFDHSASPSADGKTAYLAYWDAGAIIVDSSNPGDVRMLGRTVYPAGSEGDTHSAMPNAAHSAGHHGRGLQPRGARRGR